MPWALDFISLWVNLFMTSYKALLETLEPVLRNLVVMSALVCSLLSAPKSGFAWLKPCCLLGTDPSLVGSPVHQCLLANLGKIMTATD